MVIKGNHLLQITQESYFWTVIPSHICLFRSVLWGSLITQWSLNITSSSFVDWSRLIFRYDKKEMKRKKKVLCAITVCCDVLVRYLPSYSHWKGLFSPLHRSRHLCRCAFWLYASVQHVWMHTSSHPLCKCMIWTIDSAPQILYLSLCGSREPVRQSAVVWFGACWRYLLWGISNYLGLSPSHNPEWIWQPENKTAPTLHPLL